MRPVDIISKTRDKISLTSEELKFWVEGYTSGAITDYQASAWCMAVLLNGLTTEETTNLTLHMANSGDTLDLHSIAPFVVDKHSTGGVGDKTTLVVAPLVAASDLPVGKMSGRGLGFSGGTVDKLESFSGFRVDLSTAEFMDQLGEIGIVVSGQSADLAPADGKFYALRDVTGTVTSLPLIASSIMSKKIAAGADAIVLDVKVGNGAFMETLPEAEALAQAMVDIGRGVGRKVSAVISDMNQPLGNAVGNALEVKEAIETLQGLGPADFREHCLTIAGAMLHLAGKTPDIESAKSHLTTLTNNGVAWEKFVSWITSQGGDIDQLNDPSRLPQASVIKPVLAQQSGYISAMNAGEIGWTVVDLGGGRTKKGEAIDYGVGLVHHAKIGDYVEAGAPLVTLHARDKASWANAEKRLLAAINISETSVQPITHILRLIT
ncbi:MAG: thymidine phosphorylase [Chloroflexota bacterium]